MGDYPVVILQAFILFPIVAFLFTLPYVVFNYHKYGSVLSLRIIIVYSFILYLMCIYFLVILPLPSIAEVSAMTGARIQLVPFKFVGDILRRAHIVPSQPRTYTGIFNPAFFQFLFNVIMTVPYRYEWYLLHQTEIHRRYPDYAGRHGSQRSRQYLQDQIIR